jgi:N utilization substance protein A
MATTADIPRLEMLQVADMVAREKSIEREEVLEAMEQAIQKAGRAKYGLEHDIRAEIDRKTGEIKLLRYMQVADPVENENVQVALAEAQRRNPEAQVGDFLTDELPPIDFGRVAAQTAKQVITQRMRESERKRQYEEFKDRVGEIVSGVVKRVDYGNITVDLQRAEGVIRRDETIPRESLRVNDRVRAYIFDVREEPRGPQIFLSRSHPQFMAKLRRLRRHARQPRPGRGAGAAGREGRHHPVVGRHCELHRQCVGAGRGQQGADGRGEEQDRGGGARRPAQPGDRPPRPERQARLPAHRLGN